MIRTGDDPPALLDALGPAVDRLSAGGRNLGVVHVTAACLRFGMKPKGHVWAAARDGGRWAVQTKAREEERLL
jgi:hypothetical protein